MGRFLSFLQSSSFPLFFSFFSFLFLFFFFLSLFLLCFLPFFLFVSFLFFFFFLPPFLLFFFYSFFLFFFFFFSISFSSLYLSVICLFISATKKSKNKIILIQDRQKLTIEKNKLTAFEDNSILNIIIKNVYEKIFLKIK